jgi:hypothetical protein
VLDLTTDTLFRISATTYVCSVRKQNDEVYSAAFMFAESTVLEVLVNFGKGNFSLYSL